MFGPFVYSTQAAPQILGPWVEFNKENKPPVIFTILKASQNLSEAL